MGKWKNEYNSRRHYKKAWENEFIWLTLRDDLCYCIFCNTSLTTKRKSGLERHETSIKHKNNCDKPENFDDIISDDDKSDDYDNLKSLDFGDDLDDQNLFLEESTTGKNCANIKMEKTHRNPIYYVKPILKSDVGLCGLNDTILRDIKTSLTIDISKLLKESESLKSILALEPELHYTGVGIGRLTKLLMGELAQKYLKENLLDIGNMSAPTTNSRIRSNITVIEDKIQDASSQLENLRGTLSDLPKVSTGIEVIATDSEPTTSRITLTNSIHTDNL